MRSCLYRVVRTEKVHGKVLKPLVKVRAILVQVRFLDPNTKLQVSVMAVVNKFLGDMVGTDIDTVASEIVRDYFFVTLKRFIVIVLKVYDVEIRHPHLVPCQVRGIEKAFMVE